MDPSDSPKCEFHHLGKFGYNGRMRKGLLTIFLMTIITGEPHTALAEPIDRDQIEVMDGDTVRIAGERVRLIGFDTPEITEGQYRCDYERAWGERAAARLVQILDSGSIDIEYRKRRDIYNPPLARLRVDGQEVGQILIREHLAVRYSGRGPKMDWCPRFRGRGRPPADFCFAQDRSSAGRQGNVGCEL
jgi:micrococcal nuclease